METEERLSFVVTIPKSTLADLALNVHGVESLEGAGPADLAGLLEEVISAGLEDYLGEADDVSVVPVKED